MAKEQFLKFFDVFFCLYFSQSRRRKMKWKRPTFAISEILAKKTSVEISDLSGIFSCRLITKYVILHIEQMTMDQLDLWS